MAIETRASSRMCVVLLGLVLALAAPAQAQDAIIINGVSIDFGAFSTAIAPLMTPLARLTPAPTPALAVDPGTVAPVNTTESPATHADSDSAVNEANVITSDSSTQPSATPKVSPAPMNTPAPTNASAPANTSALTNTPAPTNTPTPAPSATTVAPAPTPASSHDCDASTTSLITKFFDNNVVLEGDCAAANNKYKFPFEGVPSRAQLVNMSKTAACTVLMQALLQIVPKECDFKRVPLRSTAEAVLQLAKSVKKAGNAAVLPSEQALTQAIEARRQSLLGAKAADRSTTASIANTAPTPAPPASGSSWTIADGVTSVNDDGQHILMDTNMLVVGTWSEHPDNASGSGASVPVSSSAKLTGPNAKELMDTNASSAKSASSSLQFAALSVQAALVLAWVCIQ